MGMGGEWDLHCLLYDAVEDVWGRDGGGEGHDDGEGGGMKEKMVESVRGDGEGGGSGGDIAR